jgi:hypothetical protein
MNPFEAFAKKHELIITYTNWPVLDHRFKYCAAYSGVERCGYGATEEEAIADLLRFDDEDAE